ncbi:MAG: twin-arginine translocase TatA/TatE family subunit [Pseudomonadota bacterium]
MGLGNIGLPGILLIAIVVLVLFGRGKIANLMGEVGKGITSFKKGINEGTAELEEEKAQAAKDVTPESVVETDKDKA